MMVDINYKYIFLVALVINAVHCNITMKNTDEMAFCKLFQLTKKFSGKMEHCCSSPLLESRRSLCEKCQLSTDVKSMDDIDESSPISVYEYKFVIGIIKQVMEDELQIMNDAIDISLETLPKLSMDSICPAVDHSGEPQLDFLTPIQDNSVLHNVIVKSVDYFSASEQICTNLPIFNVNEVKNKSNVKTLLHHMVVQMYRGIPYCPHVENVSSPSRVQGTNRANGNSFLPFESFKVQNAKMKSAAMVEAPQPSHNHPPHVSGANLAAGETNNDPSRAVTSYKPGYKGWLAAFIAIAIISLISVAMILIVGLKKNIKVYRYVLEAFVASAVAALLTDSLLHLYPHALGIHDHDHDHHNHGGPKPSIYASTNFIWKGIIVVATIYVFYLMEYIMIIAPKLLGTNVQHHHHHQHHHDHFHQNTQKELKATTKMTDEKKESFKLLENAPPVQKSPNNSCSVVCRVDDHIAQHRAHSGVPIDCVEHIQEVHASEIDETPVSTIQNNVLNTSDSVIVTLDGPKPSSLYGEKQPVPAGDNSDSPNKSGSGGGFLAQLRKIDKLVWMLTIGDLLHNCIDGIIIGTQFMEEWPEGLFKGIMTSVAILCHEVPHEVGDYAAMLASGLNVRKAIFFNGITHMTCFLGGLIGCGLGSTVKTSWIEPIIAGIFVYIGLTVLMPNLIKSLESAKNPFKLFLCHTLGYIFGCTILIAISFHEESLMSH